MIYVFIQHKLSIWPVFESRIKRKGDYPAALLKGTTSLEASTERTGQFRGVFFVKEIKPEVFGFRFLASKQASNKHCSRDSNATTVVG